MLHVSVEEFRVNDISLKFVDPKSEEPLAKGGVKADVLTRLLCTKRGQVQRRQQLVIVFTM